MVVLFDVSAWEYLRTPPIVASVDLERDGLAATLPECLRLLASADSPRKNAREAETAVVGRLLGDLKGLSLPVHVMCDAPCSEHRSDLVHVHRLPAGFPRSYLEPIGGGLHVPMPEAAVCLHGQHRGVAAVAKMVYEACGVFALCPQNERVRLATRQLEAAGLIGRGCIAPDQRIYAYHGEDGRPLGFLDGEGEPLPWEPCYDRRGVLTDLWRRPPLTSVEAIAGVARGLRGTRYLSAVERALGMCRNGAASPAEAKAAMVTCFDAHSGGEGWGSPKLNMRIPFSSEAQRLAGRSCAVADCLWEREKVDFEVNGMAFHADAEGFLVETGRRPALESMGYKVFEVTPAQMADLETLETMLENFSRQTGMPLKRRTVAFLKARKRLHEELFGRPYEPVWDGARRRKNEPRKGMGRRRGA